MRNIEQLLKEIIPPSNYQHRNGFSNEHKILSLSEHETEIIEQRLIEMLKHSDDNLIGESLAIMKSQNSLRALKERLRSTKNPNSRIAWASYINEINNGDCEMKDLALKEFDNISGKYSLIEIFHVLAYFNDSRINEKIRTYIDHKDYLIAYNARTALGIDTKAVVERERKKQKKWWKFW